jgi:hypothetical protein
MNQRHLRLELLGSSSPGITTAAAGAAAAGAASSHEPFTSSPAISPPAAHLSQEPFSQSSNYPIRATSFHSRKTQNPEYMPTESP